VADPVRLLVVDDIADNRDLLVRRLRRLGYAEVDTAEDGLDALEAIRRKPYDTVLLDVMMPRMNGIEVLETLAADAKLARTPVIMISAATEIDTVVRCIELGAEDYLPKPFNATLLRARLGTVLEKKRLRDEVDRQLARLEYELADARRQQLDMVPHEFPSHPVAVHAMMVPAREVGGDFYDCFEAAPGTLCLAIGDVSGKGMPAALFMARTRSLLRASALQHVAAAGAPPTPSDLVWVLNEELCKNNDGCMFVTLFVGFLDTASGNITFSNAGHLKPIRVRGPGDVEEVESPPGPPLGLRENIRHANLSMTLAQGERLILITDGLPEMTDPNGAFYTLPRVLADAGTLADASPETITRTMSTNVLTFAAGLPAADDVTVMAVLRGGMQ
jgi:phosphoserine phosphatase RsbU/P